VIFLDRAHCTPSGLGEASWQSITFERDWT